MTRRPVLIPPPQLPQSPDLKPWKFLLWGSVKDSVFMPPPPTNIPETERRNIKAVTSVTGDEQAKV